MNKGTYFTIPLIFLLILLFSTSVFAAAIDPAKQITNPLGDVTTINPFITKIISFLLGLVGVLALLALVWGGFKYILGFVDEKNVEEGKKIIKWAMIGLGVVILSWAILSTISGALGID